MAEKKQKNSHVHTTLNHDNPYHKDCAEVFANIPVKSKTNFAVLAVLEYMANHPNGIDWEKIAEISDATPRNYRIPKKDIMENTKKASTPKKKQEEIQRPVNEIEIEIEPTTPHTTEDNDSPVGDEVDNAILAGLDFYN